MIRIVLSGALILGLCAEARAGVKASFADPAPPRGSTDTADAELISQPKLITGLTFHAVPQAIDPSAAQSDWPSFLGPAHNNVSTESKLLKDLAGHPRALLWEMAKGQSYTAPAVSDGCVVLFHRLGERETIDCLDATSGQPRWRYSYLSDYEDRYGYCNGPRSSPAIADRKVVAIDAAGRVHCLDLKDGHLLWQRDLVSEFKLKQNFFGVGASPLIDAGRVIINVGASGGPCVAAFDLRSGRMLWGAGDQWGPSYATPVPATLRGKRRVLVFAGGESRPPTGGLMCIDPTDGAVEFSFPWRGTRRESVNASSPLPLGDSVFVSECYGSGGALLDIAADLTCKPRWTNQQFGTHFMTAMSQDGYLYGVDGHGPQDADFCCVRQSDGVEIWRVHRIWNETLRTADGPRQIPIGLDRCSLVNFPAEGRCLCLGEYGHLLWLDLNPKGFKELSRTWLFAATDTWTPPVVSHGLLYVCQNQPGLLHDSEPRLLCYDLRGSH